MRVDKQVMYQGGGTIINVEVSCKVVGVYRVRGILGLDGIQT